MNFKERNMKKMEILSYINNEFWCSFKNNNRTLFERSLWIMGATKYKHKVIKNLITEDITIYYSNNTRQLRGFNGNQKPIDNKSLINLNSSDLVLFIDEYYILKYKLYNVGENLVKVVKNNAFENFRKLFKKFIILHAKIFSYEYLISSLGQELFDKLSKKELEKFSKWKNREQVNCHNYFEIIFKYIENYFNLNESYQILELYSHVKEILCLLDNKLSANTLIKRINKRKNGFVLCNLNNKKYSNKVLSDVNMVKEIKNRLEGLENNFIFSQNEVKGQSTYEDKLVISGECVVVKNSDIIEDIFNKIVVVSITTPNDIYKYLDSKALIVDHGGILSHAAIFSREFHKPCLMGTEVGTKIFKTGDIIEIDFKKNIAYKINNS